METHERLDNYNAIWLSVPAYHDPTPKKKSHEEICQWNGKEMKEMSRYLLGVVTQTLQGGNSAQHPIFKCASVYPQALSEFNMYTRYKCQDDATLSYLKHAFHCFQTFRDVLLLGRAGNQAQAKANSLRTELMQKRMVDKEHMLKLERCPRSTAKLTPCGIISAMR
jgi:hypothetical protein